MDDYPILTETDHAAYIRNCVRERLPDKKIYFFTDYIEGGLESPEVLDFSLQTFNVKFIPSFEKINSTHLKEIKNKESFLVWESYLESGERYIKTLYLKCLQQSMPTEQIIVLGASYDYQNIANKFAGLYNVKPFTVIVYNFCEKFSKKKLLVDVCKKHSIKDIPHTTKELKDITSSLDIELTNPLKKNNFIKRFIFLNNVPRLHRIALTSMLYHENLMDKGYVSFHKNFSNDTLNHSSKFFKEPISTAIKTFDFRKNLPIMLDELQLVSRHIHIEECEKKRQTYHGAGYYNQDTLNAVTGEPGMMRYSGDLTPFIDASFLHVVAETFYSYDNLGFYYWGGNKECRWLTEKMFKPILFKQPFILLTLPNSIEVVKKLGYETFSGIIDESYDQESDDTKRLCMVLEEIKRISELDDETLDDYRKRLIPIVEHNFQVFLNKTNYLDDPF